MVNQEDNADKFALTGILVLVVVGIVALFFCTGCACTSVTKTCANGDKWKVSSDRLFWQTENVSVKTPDGTIVEVHKTQPDTEAITASAGAIGAIAGAAVKAAK